MSHVELTPRSAVLVFASDLASHLSHRQLPHRLAPLLTIPRLAHHELRADVHLFTTRRLLGDANHLVHSQRGRSFGERLENAVETLARSGYERIVVVGRDVPQLTADDVRTALGALDSHRLVLGPDHRGGCWLIAFHARDRASLLNGIHWQQNIDFAELASRIAPGQLLTLEVKIDLDRWQDARLLARFDHRARSLVDVSQPSPHRAEFSPRSITLAFARRQRPPPASRLPVVVAV
jgi:glycosyltransferase A (GT-A) superfamily protein (DUF2064 family)